MIKKFAGKKKGAPTGLGALAAQPLTNIPAFKSGGNAKKPPADPTEHFDDASASLGSSRKGPVSGSLDGDSSLNQRKNRQTMNPAQSAAVLTMKKRFAGVKKGGK